MDRLCDEVVQLIFFELDNPSALTLTSKRFHHFSQDPYVRAHYFLARYGPVQAMFWALGRGRLLSENVIDVLLTSGALISRYLVQVAMHHYFRTSIHFIKTTWVRTVPFPVFAYFMKVAADMYGEIPVAKGEDDGTIFSTFLKESKFPADMKSVKWEDIKAVMEKYKFMPFSVKDPLMAQFPLALAVEPQLLPLAVTNGFRMDVKYRDFVFRKMFEKPSVQVAAESRTDDIVRNVRELCRLDSTMFLSRTVAAEVCMEAKVNEAAYNALKKLDQSGGLLFELSPLVEELIKLFVQARTLTTAYTIQCLHQLYNDFRSEDPTVRLVMLLTVFLSDSCSMHTTPMTLHSKLEPLNVTPLSRKDIFNVLTNPFIEKILPIIEYAEKIIGLTSKDIRTLVEDVAARCLEIGCKGKTLQKLFCRYSYLHGYIRDVIIPRYQIEIDDLPSYEDDETTALNYEARLGRDYLNQKTLEGMEVGPDGDVVMQHLDQGEEDDEDEEDELGNTIGNGESEESNPMKLGQIGPDTLSAMIRQDENAPSRLRRRHLYYMTYSVDIASKFPYPSDALQVGAWIKNQYGVRSPVAAIFMTHAVVNDNSSLLTKYIGQESRPTNGPSRVPITLKHFKLLARLGRAPSWYVWHEITLGAEFFFSEEDYLSKQSDTKNSAARVRVKSESPHNSVDLSPVASGSGQGSPLRGKRRPRRTAATSVKSYVDPDSDDETIAQEDNFWLGLERREAKKRKVESNLQQWIKHLSVIFKEEQKKFKEKKKRMDKLAAPDAKPRVPKSEFLKAITSHLRDMRRMDQEKRVQLYGIDMVDDDYSEGDDDEYHYKNNRTKRRRIS